jgi:hypothetical protein
MSETILQAEGTNKRSEEVQPRNRSFCACLEAQQPRTTSEARQAHLSVERTLSSCLYGQQLREQPTGLGLRPGVKHDHSYGFYSAKPNERSETATNVIGHSIVQEYHEPKRLDRSAMSPRGKQFFSSCPG